MSDKRRRKLEKRRRKNEKRERQHDARALADTRLECPNCGDMYKPMPEAESFHRAGPCDCDPFTLKKGEILLEKRSEEYESAKGGKIPCRTCATLHGERDQQTIFLEGRLVWDGCSSCYEKRFPEVFAIFEAHRDKWFGPDRPRRKLELTPEQAAHEKYVAPFAGAPDPPRLS